MRWLTLNDIKDQLRIPSDFTDEDRLLERYGKSAENTVLNLLGRTYYDLLESYGQVPEDVIEASLILVDVSYQFRSPVSVQNLYNVQYSVDAKLMSYRRATTSVGAELTKVPIGDDTKVEFTAELPDDLKLADVGFTGQLINADTALKVPFTKDDCIMVGDGQSYVVLVDTELMGVGQLLLKVTLQIPDTDYPTGYRRTVVNINPGIIITGCKDAEES